MVLVVASLREARVVLAGCLTDQDQPWAVMAGEVLVAEGYDLHLREEEVEEAQGHDLPAVVGRFSGLRREEGHRTSV